MCGYLWWSFGDRFIAEGLQGLHGSIVSGCLAGASLANKLITPHRQLHIEDLRNRVMVPGLDKSPKKKKKRGGRGVIETSKGERKRETQKGRQGIRKLRL